MENPINLQIRRSDGSWSIVEVVPVLVADGNVLKASGGHELYEGFPEHESKLYDAVEMQEGYLESMDLQGADHPGFLGELLLMASEPMNGNTMVFN